MSQRFTIKNRRVGSGHHALDIFDSDGHVIYTSQIQLRSGLDHMTLCDVCGNEIAHYRARAFEERGIFVVTMATGVRFTVSFSGAHHVPHVSVHDYEWNLDRSAVHGMYHIVNARGEKIATIVKGQDAVSSYVATIDDVRHTQELMVLLLIVRFLLEHR